MGNNPNIRKKEEFDAFLKVLEGEQVGHWQEVAQAIGVNKDTITEWKKLPEAQERRSWAISHALNQMEVAGSKDWRMWEAKLKMLGVNPTNKVDLRSEESNMKGLVIFRPERRKS